MSSISTQYVYDKSHKFTRITSQFHQTAIHDAICNSCYIDVVSICTINKDKLNLSDGDGLTPLHYACLLGKLEVVMLLCKLGVNLNLTDRFGIHALSYAVYSGRLEIVEFLCRNNSVSQFQHKVIPLHIASLSNNIKILEFLCYKFSHWVEDDDVQNPLYFAIMGDAEETADFLIRNYPYLLNKKDRNYLSPIIFAAVNCKWEMLKFLISKGADTSVCYAGRLNVLHYAVFNSELDAVSFLAENCPELIEKGDDFSLSPFFYSMVMNDNAIQALLLKELVSSNKGNQFRQDTLRAFFKYTKINLASTIFKEFPHLNKIIYRDGMTALLYAIIWSDDLEVIEFLIKDNPNLCSMLDSQGLLPVYHVILKDKPQVINLLAKQDPRFVISPDRDQIFPIDFATSFGSKKVIECLTNIHHGYKCIQFINQQHPLPISYDKKGKAFFDLARVCDDLDLVKDLCKRHSDLLRAYDDYGTALIHYAVLSSKSKIVEFLLEVQPTLIRFPNKFGMTCLHFAIFMNNLSMINYCVQKDPVLFFDNQQNRDLFSLTIILNRLRPLRSIFVAQKALGRSIDNKLLVFLLNFAHKNHKTKILKFLTSLSTGLEFVLVVGDVESNNQALQRILRNINNILVDNQIKSVDDLLTLEFATLHHFYDYCLQRRDILLAAEQYGLKNIGDQSFAVASVEMLCGVDRAGYEYINNVFTKLKQNAVSITHHIVTLIVSLDSNHWVTLVISHRSGHYCIYYADSRKMGIEAVLSHAFKDILGVSVRIEDVSILQQEKNCYDDGIWALVNARDINTALVSNRNVSGCLKFHLDTTNQRELILFKLERRNNSPYPAMQIEIPDQSREQVHHLLLEFLKYRKVQRANESQYMKYISVQEAVPIRRIDRISGREAPILDVIGSSNFTNPCSIVQSPEVHGICIQSKGEVFREHF